MVYAMRFLRGEEDAFLLDTYSFQVIEPYGDRIDKILRKRQLIASDDWKAFGEELSGKEIPDFDINRFQEEYVMASKQDKENTFLGKFFKGAITQKSMVTNEIFRSGNMLAGYSMSKIREKG
jgi:hypothetical protein